MQSLGGWVRGAFEGSWKGTLVLLGMALTFGLGFCWVIGVVVGAVLDSIFDLGESDPLGSPLTAWDVLMPAVIGVTTVATLGLVATLGGPFLDEWLDWRKDKRAFKRERWQRQAQEDAEDAELQGRLDRAD